MGVRLRRRLCFGAGYALAAFVLAACGGAERDDSGEIVEGGDIDVFSFEVGDCFDDPPGTSTGVAEVPAVPCSESHDNEVFALGDHPADDDAPYPGDAAMQSFAEEFCLGEFEGYVGISYDESRFAAAPFFPSQDTWEQQDDREFVCFLYDLESQKLTGSMKDSGE